MRLGELIEGMQGTESISGRVDADVTGVQYDSRRLAKGDAFVALRGEHQDGAAYIDEAIMKGASAVVAEGPQRPDALGPETPYVGVSDARAALAHISNVFNGRPSELMRVVGITGTNGKTTVAHMLRSAIAASGQMVGMIGTIKYYVGDEARPAPFTTPEAPEFQGLLREMHEAGCLSVVSEVSSHALAQRRVDNTRFEIAVFTNLTAEHLDFHHTMDEYFQAKSRLFLELLDGTAVINMDDPYGRELVHICECPVITYAVRHEADIMASNISSGPEGLSFTASYEGNSFQVRTGLLGRPNVENMLAAAGACVLFGLDLGEAFLAISNAEPVEGRFMRVQEGQDFLCIIDFAHTGDALRRLIESAREFTARGGRVITVFGCGGDRDKTKRPVMGAAATELSDLAIITSDNSRSESAEAIINDIVRGAASANYTIVPGRAEAISTAIALASTGDTVLIAGKGHEGYQEADGVRMEFSDMRCAREAIRLRGKVG